MREASEELLELVGRETFTRVLTPDRDPETTVIERELLWLGDAHCGGAQWWQARVGVEMDGDEAAGSIGRVLEGCVSSRCVMRARKLALTLMLLERKLRRI